MWHNPPNQQPIICTFSKMYGNIHNMANTEFLSSLNYHGCSIEVAELFCGQLDTFIQRGGRVLTLCNDGTGRSATVADRLTNNYGIPAIRLNGGLKQFVENPELKDCVSTALYMINSCPNIAVILTKEEVHKYKGLLSNIRCIISSDSTKAIETIRRMESL